MLNIFKKKFWKNLQEQKSSLDPENFRSSDQQPFNYFSVFAVFRTLPDASTPRMWVEQKQKKYEVTGEKRIGAISQEERIL